MGRNRVHFSADGSGIVETAKQLKVPNRSTTRKPTAVELNCGALAFVVLPCGFLLH